MSDSNLVWYVCYGSNLLEERFLCYIRGGLIPGNEYSEIGSKDKALPLKSEPCYIPHKLFFAYSPAKWNGSGVAFLNPIRDGSATTYGRKYLITKDQFLDVIKQENSIPIDTKVVIDYDKLNSEGTLVLFENSYYGRLLYLGESNGIPMCTFTCVSSSDEIGNTCLRGSYYDVIAAGLKETFGLNDEQIQNYLKLYC